MQTPLILDDREAADAKLDRIVCRSGDCVDNIKKDPEFDSFLGQVLENFEAYKAAPEFASADFYLDGVELGAQAPQRPLPIGQPTLPGAVGRPVMPEPVQGTRGIDAPMKGRRFRDQVPTDLDLENSIDRSIDRSGFKPSFSYEPEYAGHGLDLDSLKIERDAAIGADLFGGFQVPELSIEASKRAPMKDMAVADQAQW